MKGGLYKKAVISALIVSSVLGVDSTVKGVQLQKEINLIQSSINDIKAEINDYINIIDSFEKDIHEKLENVQKNLEELIHEEVQAMVNQCVKQELDKMFMGEYRISFYDTSHNSQEGWGYQTASGVSLEGKNINDRLLACPPEIPLGTDLYLDFKEAPELSGIYTCVDRGGAIKGNKIDVFYEDYNMPNTVWDMGIKYADVYMMGE